MITSSRAGPLTTISRCSSGQYASKKLIVASRIGHHLTRQYAEKHSKLSKPSDTASELSRPERAALDLVESRAKVDRINPPRSTRPPPLDLPERGSGGTFQYLFRLGRAYGTFYKDGIKAVWFNYKAAKLLKARLVNERGAKDVGDAVAKNKIERSEFQMLARNSHDLAKLPLFGLLVVVFGEWLVLIVPYIPNRVPMTCRIPKQITGMRQKAEERRRNTFRQGVKEPASGEVISSGGDPLRKDDKSASKGQWPVAFDSGYRSSIIERLSYDQVVHVSSTLGLHNNLWDRAGLAPPAFLLRRSLNTRLEYLSQDDSLLLQSGDIRNISAEELYVACEERGFDILGQKPEDLLNNLKRWLKLQREDSGSGSALWTMLFRR